MVKIPAFDEIEFFEYKISESLRTVTIPSATKDVFASYCTLLEENSYVKKEERITEIYSFCAYQNGNDGVFVTYFPGTQEVRIVLENNTAYFSYTDNKRDVVVTPQITHVKLYNYGMSYAIRVSDGRFVIIDGGNKGGENAKNLYNALKEQSPYEKPVIAMWIMTHPHGDHFHCFIDFWEMYKNDVEIESFVYDFPSEEDEKYPLMKIDKNVQIFYDMVKESGAAVYTAHTGQIYRVADAVFEILTCLDDTVHINNRINATSLMLRMELGGQVVFWGADGSCEATKLAERYGKHLKADIMQIPHHGIGSGSHEAAMTAFEFIRPDVCLFPSWERNIFNGQAASKKSTKYLISVVGVKEMITGDEARVLSLPYTPREFAQKVQKKCFDIGQSNFGATSWSFTNLNTARKGDFVFTVMNSTYTAADILIEIFFENDTQRILTPRIEVGRLCVREFSVIDTTQVTDDLSIWGEKFSLGRGYPKRAKFGIRFISDVPIVVSHKKHKAAYHSSVI